MPGTNLSEAADGAADTGQQAADESQTEETQAGTPADEAPPPPETGSTSAEDPSSESDAGGGGETKDEAYSAARKELSRFRALDPVDGPKWWEEGKTFEEAQGLAMAKLAQQRDALQTRLASVNRGEEAPLGFSSADPPAEGEKKGPTRFSTLPAGLAQFASGLTLPGRS